MPKSGNMKRGCVNIRLRICPYCRHAIGALNPENFVEKLFGWPLVSMPAIHMDIKPPSFIIRVYRARLKGFGQVWWILLLLLLTTSASTCLQHSHNLGPVF